MTMHMGPEIILANISVDFTDRTSAEEVETTIVRIDHQIKSEYPNVKRIFIESEARANHPQEDRA